MTVRISIPLVNLKRQAAQYHQEFLDSFNLLLDKADFIGGETVSVFEKLFSTYCQAKYCIGVGNGTDALYLIFKALGLKPGDEVITSTMSFIATAEIFAPLGVKVVFADIDPVTYTLDPAKVRPLINKNTKALLPVHLYGQPGDLSTLKQMADEFGLYLIEDAAQAHGSEFAGKRIGSWGHAAAFSFYPGKNLGAFGDGGGVTTSDAELAHKVRMYANHGRLTKYEHAFEGINSRLDTLQAAILLVKLSHLDEWNSRRQELAALYNNGFQSITDLILPAVGPNRTHVYHLYVIKTRFRDELLSYLLQQGIQGGIHYPIPLHLQPAFAYLGYQKGDFPISEKLSEECLSLPLCPDLSLTEAEYILNTMKSFYKNRSSIQQSCVNL